MIKVNIRKPLYGNFCYIRSSVVDKAIREGQEMQVTVPNGTAIMDPVRWKETGKIMKKVFKYKDTPMILYGNFVRVPLPQPTEKKETVKKEIVVEEVQVSEKQLKLF